MRRLVHGPAFFVLLAALSLVGGCGTGAARRRAITRLQLHPVAGTRLLMTGNGCVVESVVAGRAAVTVAHSDDSAHVLTNRAGTVAVKAVGLDSRCRMQLRRRLDALP